MKLLGMTALLATGFVIALTGSVIALIGKATVRNFGLVLSLPTAGILLKTQEVADIPRLAMAGIMYATFLALVLRFRGAPDERVPLLSWRRPYPTKVLVGVMIGECAATLAAARLWLDRGARHLRPLVTLVALGLILLDVLLVRSDRARRL
jgi:hypothetical protein